jgi:hypothetical protein
MTEQRVLERLHEVVQHHRSLLAEEQQARAAVYALVRDAAHAGTETWVIAEVLEVTSERVRQILAKTP